LTIQEDVALGHDIYESPELLAADRDRLLVEAHLRRDADAFAVIVDDHRDALLAQARRVLGPDGPVEDVVQETFERALKYLPRFGRSGEYRLGAWLSQILKSVIQNHWERRARDLRSLQATAAHLSPEADVADKVGDPVTAAALNQAVRDLPESQRAAFVMRELVGLPYADVAEVLNITEANARARVSRSKGQLRKTTSGFRSAVSALLGVPAGVKALASRLTGRDSRGGRFGTGERIATQVATSQPVQTALSVASNAPRGSLVFGIAATVATLSAGTVALVGATNTHGPSLATTATVAVQSPSLPGSITGSGATASGPATPAGTPGTRNFSWVDPSNSLSKAGAGLVAANCASTNGVAPPAGPVDVGTPLGITNAQAIGQGPAVSLSTVGPSFGFASPVSITQYGGFGSAYSADLATNVCLSSSGAWFTGSLTGLGPQVELQGSLQQVIGTGTDVGYVFRGTVAPAASLTGPLAGVEQFVVDVTVTEPDNTAQVTVVFLSPDPQAAPPPAPPSTATATPPNGASTTPGATDGTGTAATDSTPTNATSGAPTTLPGGDQGSLDGGASGSQLPTAITPFGGSGSSPVPPAFT